MSGVSGHGEWCRPARRGKGHGSHWALVRYVRKLGKAHISSSGGATAVLVELRMDIAKKRSYCVAFMETLGLFPPDYGRAPQVLFQGPGATCPLYGPIITWDFVPRSVRATFMVAVLLCYFPLPIKQGDSIPKKNKFQ